jgi:two-component system KDP operon response regulator KdpE
MQSAARGEEDLAQSSKRILVVDDDPDTCAMIVDVLTGEGYTVCSCLRGKRALELLRKERFDLVLADIRMPGVSGLDLLGRIRDSGHGTRVIIMTAYASTESAIQALRNRASDYLVKPFSLVDLRRRVREALPEGTDVDRILCYLDLRIDLDARRAWVGKEDVDLTRQEFDLLACLFQRRGCTVTWQELLLQVWGTRTPEKEMRGALRSCVRRLRQKLGDDAQSPRYIVNRWGEGYRLGE